VLLLSPSDRQSGERAAKVFGYYGALDQPIGSRKRTDLQLHLVNGARVVALPKNEKTIRGFLGARLLVVHETRLRRALLGGAADAVRGRAGTGERLRLFHSSA